MKSKKLPQIIEEILTPILIKTNNELKGELIIDKYTIPDKIKLSIKEEGYEIIVIYDKEYLN